MKKFLSLVLALAMTLSLVTISAGAKDFTDSDELSGVVYEEAVNVMSEMEIIDGYADGDFRPQGTLTRGAAAKIIACMMLGKTTAEALGTQAAPFKDVPVGSTFAGYIAYCVEAGLIDGYADGTFRPQGTLTGFAFLKMLLTALGYDSSIEGYTGSNWTVNVASRATQIGLTDGNDEFVGTQPATREEACLYAVNTLKATLVEYENKGQEIVVSDGTVINVRPSAPTYVTSNIAGAATSIDDTEDNTTHDYTVEFAEKYQPDLELDGTTDDFGRPAHIWTWKNDEIGTYVDYDKLVAEYTTKITGDDLYDLLGRAALDECKDRVYIYVDGETDRSVLGSAYFTKNQIAKNYDDAVGETGNGVLTQVFHDTRADEITVAVINTYLAKAAEDYDEKNDEAELDVYMIKDAGKNHYVKFNSSNKNIEDKETMTVSGEDFDIDEVADGDLFLVTVADGAIQTMDAPEVLAGSTVSSFRIDKYVVSEGTQYDFASTAEYDVETLYNWTDGTIDPNLKNVTYDIILDPYGYAIGVKLVEEPNQYLFLTGLDLNDSYLGAKNADANVIFLSGEMDTVSVDLRNSRGLKADGTADGKGTLVDASDKKGQLNTWCTYTVDSNGNYTLREVPSSVADSHKVMQAAQTVNASNEVVANEKIVIDEDHVSLRGAGAKNAAFYRVYGDDETVYINVDNVNDLDTVNVNGDKQVIIDDVDSVTVGVKNVSLEITELGYASAGNFTNEVYTLHDDDGDIIAVVTVGEDMGSSTNFAYITGPVNRESYGSDSDKWSWTIPAIVDGKAVELQEVGTTLNVLGDLVEGEWYEVRYDADGNVRGVKGNVAGTDEIVFTVAGDKFVDEVTDLEDAFEDFDTVLAHFDYTGSDAVKLDFDHGTLYVYNDKLKSAGFSVSSEVNVVLCLADKNHNPFDDVDDSYTGYSGLEKALRNLDDEDGDLDGYLSVVFENGRATSIILDDRTGPRSNRDDAATPNVELDDTTPSVTVGGDVTLTADVVNDDDCDELTYQWYELSTATGAKWTRIPGATSRSYTIENATKAMDGYKYWCEATNTDERSSVTGETVVSNATSDSGSVATLKVTEVQVDVLVTFVDSSDPDKVIGEYLTTVNQASFITVNGNDMLAEAAKKDVDLANYVVDGRASQTKEPSANGTVMFEFEVRLKAATLDITLGGAISGYKLIGDAQRSITIGDPIEITVERPTIGEYTGFNGYTWTIVGDDITPDETQAKLTDKGAVDGNAEITFYATIAEANFVDGATYEVTVSAVEK